MPEDIRLNSLDRHFGSFIMRESGAASPFVGIVASLVSSALANASVCLNLEDIAGKNMLIDGDDVSFPQLDELRETLKDSAAVGSPGEYRPLILDSSDRLYLYRYWKYEHDVARVILEKTAQPICLPDPAVLLAEIRELFPTPQDGIDWQLVAVMAALQKRFCVISGGPGTGKTSTVAKIIALLLRLSGDKTPRIALAAPTGKAVARLKESLGKMKEELNCGGGFPDVSTIHRLLGSIPRSSRFRFSQENPLSFDAVIVDEASMVDLSLMAKLVVALKPESRLILLGDRDQLASVEAGAVLGDICGSGRSQAFSADFRSNFAAVTGADIPEDTSCRDLPPLADSVVVLRKNYRFGDESGIGSLSRLINEGSGVEAMELLASGACGDLSWRDLPPPEGFTKAITNAILDGFGAYLEADEPAEALRRFGKFRVFCAVRKGAYGVEAINRLAEEILARRGLVNPRNRWYRGRPIMITANDYNLKLFNGDIGIIFPDASGDGGAFAHFSTLDGETRVVSPLRLPEHETVYAMTVHKSQGSEFEKILLLLPPHDSAIMTRELVYTGITRARRSAEVWGEKKLFISSVERVIERKSGLAEALWGKT